MLIGIYGLGRFGAFWADLCRKLPGTTAVRAYNRSDRPCPEGVERVELAALAECELIFLCCAISAMPEVCRQLAALVRPGTLVVDTCSVKVWPVGQMLEHFGDGVEIVASHPMFGPDSARGGLAGLPLMLAPVRVAAGRFDALKAAFAALGLKVIVMSPDEHDRQAARTQGITHYVGRLLAELGLEPSEIATLGYRKLAEITEQTCNDPWQLFVDLQRYNPYTTGMRRGLRDALHRLNDKLEEGMKD
jgi:prephenate dehydrogenase